VAALLVGHTLLDRLPTASGEHHLDRFDDEEEDGRSDGYELNQIGEKRSVMEDGPVDRECEVAEVGFSDDRGNDGHHEIVDERVDDCSKREAHDERDREFNDVAPEKKVPELFEHGYSFDSRFGRLDATPSMTVGRPTQKITHVSVHSRTLAQATAAFRHTGAEGIHNYGRLNTLPANA